MIPRTTNMEKASMIPEWYLWIHVVCALISFFWSMHQYKKAGARNLAAAMVGSIGISVLGPLGLWINNEFRSYE